jgi:preprotein translocase subunit SecE
MADDPLFAPALKEVPFNRAKKREEVRGWIALSAVITFLLVVSFYLYQASRGTATWPNVKEAMQSVLPAVASVLGTVLGFYFGSQTDQQ